MIVYGVWIWRSSHAEVASLAAAVILGLGVMTGASCGESASIGQLDGG
jgi:hypothetical protein